VSYRNWRWVVEAVNVMDTEDVVAVDNEVEKVDWVLVELDEAVVVFEQAGEVIMLGELADVVVLVKLELVVYVVGVALELALRLSRPGT